MKIIVEFDNEEEFKARIKNPRGGKENESQASAQAPAPLMPPQQQPFNPQPQPTFQPPPFPGPGASDPVVASLVQRIIVRIDGAIANGQPADTVLNWFRGQCGAEASAATMDQIKTIFLPKLAVPGLENIAKLMNA